MALNNLPVLIPHPQNVLPLLQGGGAPLNVGGIWGQVRSGQTVSASDGHRFLWYADGMMAVYYLNGKFYTQSASGFVGEIRTSPAVRGGRGALFMARVAETEMHLLMGILAGSSNIGFALVIGSEVLEFVADHREDFGAWHEQIHAVLQARKYLKAYAPLLYEKVFESVLKQVFGGALSKQAYKDVTAQIPNAVTPEIIAFGVGVVIGTAGKKAAKGKLSLLAVIFVVMEQIVVRFGLSVLPGAIKHASDEYAVPAEAIIAKLKEGGVTLDKATAMKMIAEVREHPKEVEAAFGMMKSAFEKHQAKTNALLQ